MLAETITAARAGELNAVFERSGPEELLDWGLRNFGDKIALCPAFGPEGMVLLDILSRMKPLIRVFTLDTGRLPQETHDLMQRVQDLYGFQIEIYSPDPIAVREMVKAHGINLFYHSVEPENLN